MGVKPIRPEEVTDLKETQIPDEVMEAFNAIIARKYSRGYACFRLDEIEDEIIDRMCRIKRLPGKDVATQCSPNDVRSRIYENNWMDVEDIYRKVGWDVTYEAPGYCETGPCTFTFRKKK